MTIRDFLASLVRTAVPVLAGLLISAGARAGLDLSAVAPGLVDAVCIGGYYALVRWAETRWPWVGVLLGWKAQPTYQPVTLVAYQDADGTFRAGSAAAAPNGAVLADEAPLHEVVSGHVSP